jgi:hypothetical protein
LYTCKRNNLTADVAIITNKELPPYFQGLFKSAGIEIFICEYDIFRFPSDFMWEYAFYKLNAMEWVLRNTDYDYYCNIDTDTICLSGIDYLWEELDNGYPLLCVLPYDKRNEVRKDVNNLFQSLFNVEFGIDVIGGELLAGNRETLSAYMEKCLAIYTQIRERDFSVSKKIGDEAILSIAAYSEKHITNGNAYLNRCTTRRPYIVNTAWEDIPILHLPAEKNFGLLLLFNYIKILNKCPSMSFISICCNLPKVRNYSPKMLAYYSFILIMRIRIKIRSKVRCV